MKVASHLLLIVALLAGTVAAEPAATDKTLVSWVSLANTTQQGGSAVTIQSYDRFDGIVFGEKVAGRWMAGSDGFARTQGSQQANAVETADDKTLIQMAVVSTGGQIAIYRNGEPYASYDAGNVDLLNIQNQAVFGMRHEGAGPAQTLRGSIEEARIYDRALTADELKKLEINEESAIKPYAWWTFETGQETDRTGRFPINTLSGGATIEGGRLVLASAGATLIAESGKAFTYSLSPDGLAAPVTAEDAKAVTSQRKFKGPVKVFILAGQSNMEGQGPVYGDGKGTLVWSMEHSKSADKLKRLRNEKGEWVVRDDVQISFKVGDKVLLKGGLMVGYTPAYSNKHTIGIGPELGFGFVMGDHFKEPVLLIKTAWGGKSLFVDFRPPRSGGQVGPCYTKMVAEIRAALAELGGQEYEMAGFYWQQGWNDMCDAPAIAEYAQNLVNLAKDLRTEFNAPNMPVVVGELGNGGAVTEGAMFEFRKAQEEGTKQINNAVFIKTTDFARPPELSPCPSHGHHWCANAESYFLIGEAAGEGMKSLLK